MADTTARDNLLYLGYGRCDILMNIDNGDYYKGWLKDTVSIEDLLGCLCGILCRSLTFLLFDKGAHDLSNKGSPKASL